MEKWTIGAEANVALVIAYFPIRGYLPAVLSPTNARKRGKITTDREMNDRRRGERRASHRVLPHPRLSPRSPLSRQLAEAGEDTHGWRNGR
jgi:hypothetical protein